MYSTASAFSTIQRKAAAILLIMHAVQQCSAVQWIGARQLLSHTDLHIHHMSCIDSALSTQLLASICMLIDIPTIVKCRQHMASGTASVRNVALLTHMTLMLMGCELGTQCYYHVVLR